MRSKALMVAVPLLSASMILTGCGSSSSGGSGGSGSAARGPITFVTGKDNSGIMPFIATTWNAAHPNEKVTIKQQSDQADQQLSDLQQHFQAKDPGYDVVTTDVVWSAEFAAQGWIIPLKGAYGLDTSGLLPATVKAATYNGTLYAAPYASDGGLLYYRTDLVTKAPTTWDELIADCQGKTTSGTITGPMPGCYAGQFAKYEGLTVNAAEAINAAGGQIVKDDGKTPDVNTPQAADGLNFLVNGFKQGYIPKEALGFQETQSLNAFSAGQLVFMRNWPYADAVLNAAGSKVIGKFGIAPLPGPSGHGASSLGGHSVGDQHLLEVQGDGPRLPQVPGVGPGPDATTSPRARWRRCVLAVHRPGTGRRSSPTCRRCSPASRPPSRGRSRPFYPAVTEAIETNVYAALQGQVTADRLVQPAGGYPVGHVRRLVLGQASTVADPAAAATRVLGRTAEQSHTPTLCGIRTRQGERMTVAGPVAEKSPRSTPSSQRAERKNDQLRRGPAGLPAGRAHHRPARRSSSAIRSSRRSTSPS